MRTGEQKQEQERSIKHSLQKMRRKEKDINTEILKIIIIALQQNFNTRRL